MQAQNHQDTINSNLKADIASPSSLVAAAAPSEQAAGIVADASKNSFDQKDLEIRLKFGEETHQYVRDYIRQADQKAAFFFTIAAAVLAYINTQGYTSKWLVNPTTWNLTQALSFLSAVCLAISSMFCITTVMPRLGGTKRGLIFFHAIREFDAQSDYSSELFRRSITQLCDEKYKHIYELSGVCRDKYKSLVFGFRFGILGLALALLLLFLK